MLKTILKEVKEFKLASILTPILMLLEVISELMIPLMMGLIIDKGINSSNLNAVFKYGSLMLICAFAALLFGGLSAHYGAYAAAGLAKNLRSTMFKKIQGFSFKNIDKFETSSLITRMMTDVTNTQHSYQMSLRMGVRAPFTFIIALFMTFSINKKLASIFLYAIIFLAISLLSMMYFARIAFKEAFERYDDLNSSIQENVSNIRVVKAYVKEKDETARFIKTTKKLYDAFVKAENITVLNSPIMMLTTNACIIALSWFGANMIVNKTLTTGELMSMFTYTMNILHSLMMVSFFFIMIIMSFASMKRISEIINETPSITNPKNPITEVKDGSISFKDVCFEYYDNTEDYVLYNINLDIKSGETIGIIGGTGSSKSTLVQLIPRLYDVSLGSIEVGGVDVRNYDLKILRDAVSMVLQKNTLFSGTIKDNLKWGNKNASDEEIIEAAKHAQAHDFIMSFKDGYDTHIEQGGTNVSGGQKQRLTIARALLKKPKILILDDSTSAVDTATDAHIRKAFREELPDITKLIISQRISSIIDADRIIVLDDGKINGIGTHEELLETNNIYQEVYETQYKGGDSHE
ncbi:MAG: ABC transporter ATP-binding protein [Bacillota bacterium]|nr:ABC transporter ATP-binding protein [Bacillota bacterium]NLP22524.1 ABC transporter ATP-binding protein [Erysipelotrichaceae bacterium]